MPGIQNVVFVLIFGVEYVLGDCSMETEQRDRQLIPSTKWNTNPPLLDCSNPSIDAAIVTTDGKTIFFKGDYYWNMAMNCSVVEGFPRPIADDWSGLPSNLDAALSTWTGRNYFFKGDEYWLFENMEMQPGYPRKIKDGFCGVPDNIQAAVYWPKDLSFYFFKGNQYWRFDGLEPSAPMLISDGWKDIPGNLDAAVNWFNGGTYFFKGNEYWRFNDYGTFTEPFPKSLTRHWGEICQNGNGRIFVGDNERQMPLTKYWDYACYKVNERIIKLKPAFCPAGK